MADTMKEAPIHPTEDHPQESAVSTPLHDRDRARQNRSKTPVGILVVCVILGLVAVVLGLRAHQLGATLGDTQTQLAQSKSETARAQTRIDDTNAASARLQSQIDTSGRQLSSLQARVQKSEAESTGLQSQLDKAKAQSTDLQSQLDSAKSQLTDSQAKLDQANAGTADLKKQLEQAQSQSADLQSRLQKAESAATPIQPLAQKAEQMPITTSFEKSFFSRSMTLHIKNLKSGPLTVNITANGSAQPQSATIKSGETFDVAKLEAGQTVVIAGDGYEPVKLTVH